MVSQEDIILYIKKRTGIKRQVNSNEDLNEDLGIYGDDLWEFIEDYSKTFNVDVSKFLWYFHSPEEGWPGIGGILFKPPNRRVDYLPITPEMLYQFAEKGFWALNYPEHSIPLKRIDFVINRVFAVIILLVSCLFLIWKYFFGSS